MVVDDLMSPCSEAWTSSSRSFTDFTVSQSTIKPIEVGRLDNEKEGLSFSDDAFFLCSQEEPSKLVASFWCTESSAPTTVYNDAQA